MQERIRNETIGDAASAANQPRQEQFAARGTQQLHYVHVICADHTTIIVQVTRNMQITTETNSHHGMQHLRTACSTCGTWHVDNRTSRKFCAPLKHVSYAPEVCSLHYCAGWTPFTREYSCLHNSERAPVYRTCSFPVFFVFRLSRSSILKRQG